MQRIKWNGPFEVEMPDGVVYQFRPGYRQKGVSVTPTLTGQAAGRAGRPQRRSTLKLRERIEGDHSQSRLKEPPEYMDWLMKADPTLERDAARQAVYREMRRRGATRAKPGRPAAPHTIELRKRVERDASKAKVRAPKHYVAWLLKRHPGLRKQALQQVVHRELQRLDASANSRSKNE